MCSWGPQSRAQASFTLVCRQPKVDLEQNCSVIGSRTPSSFQVTSSAKLWIGPTTFPALETGFGRQAATSR